MKTYTFGLIEVFNIIKIVINSSNVISPYDKTSLLFVFICRIFLFLVDGKKGFGGVYGIDERPKDKSAVGFDYKADVEKHPSQTGLKNFYLNKRKINMFNLFQIFQKVSVVNMVLIQMHKINQP